MSEPTELEKQVAAEEAAIAARLAELKSQPAEAPQPIEEMATPAESPPTPAAAEPPPAAATPPAPKVESEEERRAGAAWAAQKQRTREAEARARELERKLLEKEQEAAALRARQEREQQPEPTFEDNPAEVLRRETEALKAEQAALKAKMARDEQLNNIRMQEATFTAEKPDYPKALQYLVQSEIGEWQRSGLADVHTGEVLSSPQYRASVNEIAGRPEVAEMAEKEGRTADEMAASLIARDIYLTNRQVQLDAAAKRRGRNIASVVYELAEGRGYKNGTPQAKPPAEEEAARQRVLQAKRVAEAANSLSEHSTESPEGARVLRSRADVLNLSDEQLDALIAGGQFRQL